MRRISDTHATLPGVASLNRPRFHAEGIGWHFEPTREPAMTDKTDGSDPGLSSEDLIRQARAPYQGPAPEAPPAATTEPSSYSAGSAPEPPRYETHADELTRPADGIGDRYTAEPTPPADPYGATYESHQPSFIQRYGTLALFGLIGLGVILFNVLDKTKAIDDLAIGDCLQSPDGEEIESVESIDCSSSHGLELFGFVTVPDGDDAPYPGEEALAWTIMEGCVSQFERYVGTRFEDSVWWIDPWIPTQESWEDGNVRKGSCMLYENGPNDVELAVSGSARGSGR